MPSFIASYRLASAESTRCGGSGGGGGGGGYPVERDHGQSSGGIVQF